MLVDFVFFWFQRVLVMVLLWVMPVLLVAVAIGLFISLLQVVTQIHDAALNFVPKFLIAMFMVIVGTPIVFKALAKLLSDIISTWGSL